MKCIVPSFLFKIGFNWCSLKKLKLLEELRPPVQAIFIVIYNITFILYTSSNVFRNLSLGGMKYIIIHRPVGSKASHARQVKEPEQYLTT